jgi:hypothetical protein
MAKFVSMFTKERNSGRDQPPWDWTFETEIDGVVKVTWKVADRLEVFMSQVRSGYNTASSLAPVMDLSVSAVSKLAKKAQEADLIVIKNRKYFPADMENLQKDQSGSGLKSGKVLSFANPKKQAHT